MFAVGESVARLRRDKRLEAMAGSSKNTREGKAGNRPGARGEGSDREDGLCCDPVLRGAQAFLPLVWKQDRHHHPEAADSVHLCQHIWEGVAWDVLEDVCRQHQVKGLVLQRRHCGFVTSDKQGREEGEARTEARKGGGSRSEGNHEEDLRSACQSPKGSARGGGSAPGKEVCQVAPSARDPSP